MIKEKVFNKINTLNDSELTDVLNFIDYIKFKSDIQEAQSLLDYFKPYQIYTWNSLSQRIRTSGLDVGPAGGYMDRSAVKLWLKHNFVVPEEKAEEAIKLLVQMSLLRESTMTPNIR